MLLDKKKEKEKDKINLQIVNIIKIDEKEKGKLDNYELNNL